MSKEALTNSKLLGPDAVDHLTALLSRDHETERLIAQERLRVWITDGLRKLRHIRGLSQGELAERLGISQARVSRLESADFDRRIDSVAAYLQAADAEIVLAFKVGDELVTVLAPEGSKINLEPDGDLSTVGDEESLHAPLTARR